MANRAHRADGAPGAPVRPPGWAMAVRAMAVRALGLLLAPLLVGAVALGLLAGCGARSQPDLPDMPEYEQAEAFLKMQERLRAHPQEQPQPYPYTDRNEVIYDNLRQRLRTSSAELEWRARQREQKRYANRAADQAEFEAMQRRLERDQALDALREQQRAENSRAYDAGSRQRYERYQNRLDELARRQEQIAQERELNRFRHQERVAGTFEELEKNRALQLRLQQEEIARQEGERKAADATAGGTP